MWSLRLWTFSARPLFFLSLVCNCKVNLSIIEQIWLEEEQLMSILPEGEQLRRAIKWISDMRSENPRAELPKLIGEACIKFDLTPKDSEVLVHFFAEQGSVKPD